MIWALVFFFAIPLAFVFTSEFLYRRRMTLVKTELEKHVDAVEVRKAEEAETCDTYGPYRTPHRFDYGESGNDPNEYDLEDALSICGNCDWLRSRIDKAYTIRRTPNARDPWVMEICGQPAGRVSPWIAKLLSGKWEVRRTVSV